MGLRPPTADPDLDWLPPGNHGLLEAAELIKGGHDLAALQRLVRVAGATPALASLCDPLARRALRSLLDRADPTPMPAPELDGDPGPGPLLIQVLAHPAHALRLRSVTAAALRLAVLYQLVWDASVELELSLEEHASCDHPVVHSLDRHLVRAAGGDTMPLNVRECSTPVLERQIRLALAQEWLFGWHTWAWLPSLRDDGRAPLPASQRPRHWLEARTRTRQLLIEEHRGLDWGGLQQRRRDPELLSIVVPVWGAGAELEGCLHCLQQTEHTRPIEILLVDNGNADPTTCAVLAAAPEQDPRVRVLRQPQNFGFALGCNLGFAAGNGARVLFLNSDARVEPGWLEPLLAVLAEPQCRAVQPALLTPQGRIQCLGIVFGPASPLGIPLYAGEAVREPWLHPRTVPAVTAACVLLRADEFAAVQGFDVGYLNGQEDTDLCLRLTARFGGSCAVAPGSRVIHPEGSSPGRYRHIDANRSRLIHRWPAPDPGSLERSASSDGLGLVGFLPLDRPDRPGWLHAPRPVLKPLAAGPAAAEEP